MIKNDLNNIMSQRTCIMGCVWKHGETRHIFPKEPKRRAEWCRILGVFPRAKHVAICGDHFDKGYIFGDRLSKYAKPNPPPSRLLHRNITNTTEDIKAICKELYNTVNELPKELTDEEIAAEESVTNDNNPPDEVPIVYDKPKNESIKTENTGKIEDFEIRKGTTKDTIIKGRYIQTNDYLVVSYTPPRKWTLQQQLKALDEHCQNQLNEKKYLNRELVRVRRELKLYNKLLPKLRYLQTKNRCLMAALKIYKQRVSELKKKLRRERQLKLKTNKKDEGEDII